MSVVVLLARPYVDSGQEPVELERALRGRQWLCVPDEGNVVEINNGGQTFRVARRRFRTNGDVVLELRASHVTRVELEALGFYAPDS